MTDPTQPVSNIEAGTHESVSIASRCFDIFLSYSRQDRDRARLVFEALGRQGWTVFMDEDTPNATRWEEHILQQLETAACVLVLWSDASRQSKWVTREAARGIERKKLVHATLDGLPPPGQLTAFQANNLSAWDGKSSDLEFLRLLSAVANHIGTSGAVGTLQRPLPHELINEKHLALTSTSWRRDGIDGQSRFPYQIHLMIVGSDEALDRVENVLYFFDPAYAANRPEFIDPVLKAYVKASNDRPNAFGVYELANGFSVVRAAVKVRDQAAIINLSRLVDIMEKGPWLKKLYHWQIKQ